jgi:hypothetical protein
VKRPGVEVRARRGYRALRPEDMLTATAEAAAEAAGGAGETAEAAEATAVGTAIGSLAGARDGLPMYSRAARMFGPSGGTVWVAAEVDAAAAKEAGLAAGGTLTATLATADGAALGEVETPVAAGARMASLHVPVEGVTPGSEIVVRLRVRGADGALPLSDVVRVPVPQEMAMTLGAARLQRWGPSTGRRYAPAADPRFRRTDRIRVDVPVAPGATDVSAELLDRMGAALAAIPVKAALMPPDAETGTAWATADLTLAPLSAGDYVIRLVVTHPTGAARSLTGFRVVQ